MGHLGSLKPEYRQLLARLDAGQVGMPEPKSSKAREGWREILEILFSPEEAALAARMPIKPASLKTLSARMGIPPEELEPRLDRMADKGIVMDLVHPSTGKTAYFLAPPVVGFFESTMMRVTDMIPKKRMAEALEAYTHGDDAFAREVFGGDTVVGRALVHDTTLGDDELPDVLDWERAAAIVEGASKISIALCYCRHKAQHLDRRCDAPMDNCMGLNIGADFLIRRGFGRQADKAEALDILAGARELSLVHIADNVRHNVTYICNCCGCCCGQLTSISELDLPGVNPSGFQPATDLDVCKGCSRCSRACPISAISMVAQRMSTQRKNKLAPRVNLDRCIGCGVCADTCRTKAMTMQRRPKATYVPASGMERMIRMALERGRLPHLLFDAGASRGSRYLNGLVRTMCALPPIEKALATEQVRSRFVRVALKSVRNIDIA
ncbi:MAG: 4Fe-4S dicluster domain-containing protein [Actinomycetota bacterium]